MSDLSEKDREWLTTLAGSLKNPVSSTELGKIETEITACMPMFNSVETFALALRSIRLGNQTLPVSLIVCDNGSKDGCQTWVREITHKIQTPVGLQETVTLTYWKQRFPRGIQGVEVPQYDELPARFPREYYNIRACFKKMWPMVKTPYMLMLDADVELPKGALRTMYDLLRTNPEIGQVCIGYDEVFDHGKHGCSLIRIELAKQLLPNLNIEGCMCGQICTQLDGLGFKTVHVPAMSARHFKNEL